MKEVVFRPRSPGDLAMPLQQAFSRALEDRCGFRLVLPELEYTPFHVSLGSPGAVVPHMVVQGEGAEPVTLDGVSMSLSGGNVVLAGIELRGARTPAPALTVAVAGSFIGERLGFADLLRHDPMSNESIVQISALGPGGGNAVLSDCRFIGNRGEGYSAVLSTPRTGKGFLQSLRLVNCAFCGNGTAVGLDPWFTRELTIAGTLVLEGETDPWLSIRSPLVKTEVNGCLLSCTGALVRFLTGPDAAREDFPPVAARNSRLLSGEPPEHGDFLTTDCTFGPPLPCPGDSLSALCPGNSLPDFRELEERLSQTH